MKSKKVEPKHLLFCLGILILVLPLITLILDLPFLCNTLFLCIIYSVMALAWNLLGGYGGQIHLGYCAFFGVGAYVTAILAVFYDITPWVGIPIGGAFATLLSIPLGFAFFKLRKLWFAMATLTLSTIFTLLFQVLGPGGSVGITLPFSPGRELYYMSFHGPWVYTYISLLVLMVEIVVLYRLVRGKLGYFLLAIREDEDAAMAAGINVLKYKMIAMGIGAFIMGIAGGIWVVRFRFIDPYTAFDQINFSLYIFIASILGGIHHFFGPILGSLILMPLTEYIRVLVVSHFPSYYGLHIMVAGILFLVISLLLPSGVMPLLEKLLEKSFK